MLKHAYPFSRYGSEANMRRELIAFTELELARCRFLAEGLAAGGSLPRHLRSVLESFIEDEDYDFDHSLSVVHWERMLGVVRDLRDDLAQATADIFGTSEVL